MNKIKTKRLHFAWDDPKDNLVANFEAFNQATNVNDIRRKIVYVLTNFDSTHNEDLYRIETLRDLGFDPFVMIYNKPMAPKITLDLARWCNNKWVFKTTPAFADYNSSLWKEKIKNYPQQITFLNSEVNTNGQRI